MLTIKILFTINSLEKKTIHSKTLFTIPVDFLIFFFFVVLVAIAV